MRAARGVRSCVLAVLLTAVGTASTLDGQAPDFVAGDDGDALAARRSREPSLSAADAVRSADVCAANRVGPFLVAREPPRPARLRAPALLEVPGPARPPLLRAADPLCPRAPPAG